MSFAEEGFEPLPGDERLTTPIVSDSCDAAGLRHQVLQERLSPIVPGTRAIGRARTVRFAPSLVDRPDDPYADAIAMIDGIRAGQFVVIATDASNDSAFWGELFSAAAIGSGAAGVVTDGNLRDTDRIAALRFPAFSRSRRPIDFRARLRIVDVDEPVVLSGVRIETGDLVIADDDGVVVVPRRHEDEVLALARERASRESTVLAELLAGDSLRTVWDRHRVL
ncbi:RraA family protein [Microbacterium sp. Root180]|uniref:RraA family protein n=1 Tax=Microbacterium sp. Root180 TaxID=1736483 RepID=UPI0006F7E07A|nr:RraA family protein [Microbacterium sp. Root180]KRB36807.1 dimethylmenaquinone methyltransferase [Microbacterium sp. Root180]